MPPGERSQVWYPQLVALLRTEWRSETAEAPVPASRVLATGTQGPARSDEKK